jgi:ribosomal protein L4
MQKLSQPDQTDHSDEFKPKAFLFFCIDQNGDIGFEVQLGEKINDTRKFANMLNKVTIGEFNEVILDQIKEQTENISDGNKKYKIVESALKQKLVKDLVVNPTKVEINL